MSTIYECLNKYVLLLKSQKCTQKFWDALYIYKKKTQKGQQGIKIYHLCPKKDKFFKLKRHFDTLAAHKIAEMRESLNICLLNNFTYVKNLTRQISQQRWY